MCNQDEIVYKIKELYERVGIGTHILVDTFYRHKVKTYIIVVKQIIDKKEIWKLVEHNVEPEDTGIYWHLKALI